MDTNQEPTVRTTTQTAGFDRHGIVEDPDTGALLRGPDEETFHHRRRTITQTRYPDGSSSTHRSPWEQFTPEPPAPRVERFTTDPDTWVDRDGRRIAIADMDPAYAANAAAFLRRRAAVLLAAAWKRALVHVATHDGGDMTHDALESESYRLQDLVMRSAGDPTLATAWLEETYAGKLAALDARAAQAAVPAQ